MRPRLSPRAASVPCLSFRFAPGELPRGRSVGLYRPWEKSRVGSLPPAPCRGSPRAAFPGKLVPSRTGAAAWCWRWFYHVWTLGCAPTLGMSCELPVPGCAAVSAWQRQGKPLLPPCILLPQVLPQLCFPPALNNLFIPLPPHGGGGGEDPFFWVEREMGCEAKTSLRPLHW